jgi:site-specific recombinase XerD
MSFVYEMMSKKLSASMVLLRIAAIKKYYKYLIYFNAFNRVKFIDIFENLELPKVTQQKQKIYMASDVRNIVEKLEKCKTNFVSMQTLVFILIASTTGARRREIAGVKVTDIDFESNHIYFYPKGHRRAKQKVNCQE